MSKFRVWVRALGPGCRLRVDGLANAWWLLRRLSPLGQPVAGAPKTTVRGSAIYSLRVAYTGGQTRSGFETLLAAIPEIELMPEPE